MTEDEYNPSGVEGSLRLADDAGRTISGFTGHLQKQAIDAALSIAMSYGGVDGAHHKAWVIDQMVRTLTRCPTVRRSAIGAYGKPYEYDALGESEEYLKFVARHNSGEDGPETYSWESGIAP